MRRFTVVLVLLLPLWSPAVSPSRAAALCAVDTEQRGSWHRIAPGRGVVAIDSADACHLMAVGAKAVTSLSDDGGATWRRTADAPAEAGRLVTAGLDRDQVILLGATGGMWVSPDRGTNWLQAKGLTGIVRDVVVDPKDVAKMFAMTESPTKVDAPLVTVGVDPTGGLYVSSDVGKSFNRVTSATGLSVTSVLPDSREAARVWLGVTGPAGGLYLSTDDAGSFTRAAAGDVTALAGSRLAGGGSEVLAATTDGVLMSRDGGSTVSQRLRGTSFSDIALEWQHPSAVMLLSERVSRSSDSAVSSRDESGGLPAACSPMDLRNDRSIPSFFLVICRDGGTYRYRGDGTDLSSTDQPDGTPAIGNVPSVLTPGPIAMRVLERLTVPVAGSRQDGSIAFDGSVLYYADIAVPGVIHRMLAKSGGELQDLVTTMPKAPVLLAYDANRDHLLVLDRAFVVWDVALKTGVAVRLFHSPLSGVTEEQDEKNSKDTTRRFYGAMTFDSASQRLLFANDGSDTFTEYDLDGTRHSQCVATGLANVVTVSGVGSSSIAGMVATGDGLVYVQSEDQSSVIRLDRSCHVLAVFTHESYAEANAENDGLACDTTTFDVPAVWIREPSLARVTAYSVESGYCALPSTVTVTAPPGVATGQSGMVCAHLITSAKRQVIPGLPVDLLVAGRGIGSPRTDRNGTACTRYVPLPNEAGAGAGRSSRRQPVLAAFLGTPAYRPSSARATLVVSRLPLVVPPIRTPVLVPPPVPPALVALPVVPPVQPPPPPPNVPQTQPITQAQAHPGAQPGAMGALGAAPMPEEESEAATQAGDVHQMSGLGDAEWGAYALPLMAGTWMGIVAVRRRRASRVRAQF